MHEYASNEAAEGRTEPHNSPNDLWA